MKHRVNGRKLGRNTGHRKALAKNQLMSLFEHRKIRTTLAKAKNLRPLAEKLITMAKTDDFHHRSEVFAYFPKGKSSKRRREVVAARSLVDRREVVAKRVIKDLFETIAPKYKDRNGGYTRIIKLGPRLGDGAEMAQLELV